MLKVLIIPKNLLIGISNAGFDKIKQNIDAKELVVTANFGTFISS